MTEAFEITGDLPVTQPAGNGSAMAGAMLKKAREEVGLHIGALAVSLKVPVSKLEALESGNLEQLSGLVFVRALASSVCRTLKIDPTPILEQLPQAITAHLHQKGALNEPFHGEGKGVNFSASEGLLKPSILAVGALLIGALVLLFLPDLRAVLPDVSNDSVVSGGATKPSASAYSAPSATSNPAAVSEAADASKPLADPKAASAAAVPQAPATAISGSSAGASSGLLPDVPAAAVTGSEVLSFKASALSWVEVTDARGDIVLRKTLVPGEVAKVGGFLPLKAVVGRVDVTEVYLRGQRLDVQVLAKENVARFEVK